MGRPSPFTRSSVVKLVVSLSGALVAFCLCSPARASDPDPWFGRDKALHFSISIALSAGGYAASSLWLDRSYERALAGSAFSLGLGASKELWDFEGHGDPSWRDFTWDVLGTAVGTGLALATDALVHPKPGAKLNATLQGLVIRF